jgi:hypothetical protein
MLRGNQKTLHCQIRRQFQPGNAEEPIKTDGIGSSWIVEVVAEGSREGEPLRAIHLFLTPACTPRQQPCCDWCGTAGSWRAAASLSLV